MKNKKVIITGGSGLLGANLCYLFRKRFDTFFTFNKNPIKIENCSGINLDLTDFKKTKEVFKKINPKLIIHCAALTNVDYCEEHPKETKIINYKVTENIAKISKELHCKLFYISTDSVFDGKKGNYTETDEVSPLNVYAKTKLLGEKAVQEICKDYLIVRTCIYGWNAQNKLSLAEWVLDKLSKKQEVNGFKDIYFTPILVNNLGKVLLEMYDKNIGGIFNITGSERCNKFYFAKEVAKIFGYSSEYVKESSSETIKFKAKRPLDASLNINKIKRLNFKTKLLNIDDSLKLMKKLKDEGFVRLLKNISA